MLITEFIELYPQFKYSEAIKYSLYWGYTTIDQDYWCSFRYACKTGELELVQKFIHLGAPINFKHPYFCSGLEKASYRGHIKIVKLLLQNGANVYCNNDYTLHWAVEYNHTEVVNLLLKYYSPNYLISKKLHLKIDNEVLLEYYNYIRKLKLVQKQCKYYLHKPGGPFFLNGLRQLI